MPKLLPGLIELPLQLLELEIESDDFRGASLVLRDCWEASFKLLAIMLFADLSACIEEGEDESLVELIVPLLQKPPALGDWLQFYLNASVYAHRTGKLERLMVPELCQISHSPSRRANAPARITAWGKGLWDVVTWRNDTIGHGAASHDIAQVRQTLMEQREKFLVFLEELAFLRDLRLFSSAPGGAIIEWNTREHPLFAGTTDITSFYFPVWMQRSDLEMPARSLSPMLLSSVVQGRYCLLTFDKLTKGVFFLDYFLGTKTRFPAIPEIDDFQTRRGSAERAQNLQIFRSGGALSANNRSYSGAVAGAMERIEFGSDMERWFVKPPHLHQALENALGEFDSEAGCGYFHLIGAAGTGKSWFMGTLGDRHVFASAPQVLRYHIRVGMRQNPELFLESLQEDVQDARGHFVRGARIRLEDAERPSVAVARFLEDVLVSSVHDRIILVIDGLDEVLDAASEDERTVLDFLPLPAELPESVVCVLSSRPENEMRRSTRKFFAELTKAADENGIPFQSYDIAQHSGEQELAVRNYLTKRHDLQEGTVADRILASCGGSFLVARLLGRIYSLSPQSDGLNLPSDLRQVYTSYLNLIRGQVGTRLFDSLHRRLLTLLAVSPRPLSLQELSDFLALQEERLLFAFFDTGEFFAITRQQTNNTFAVSHLEFSQYVLAHLQDEVAARLREVLESFPDDENALDWLVDTASYLARSGQTKLSFSLSQWMLDQLPSSYARRAEILRSHIDMVHLTGNYRQAATLLEELEETLTVEQGLPPQHRQVVHARMRRAHHLKFVASVGEVKEILRPLIENLPEGHEDLREVEFMFHGSLGCLDAPGQAELEGLLKLERHCRTANDEYLLTRCQRRIADLLLLLGQDDEALRVGLEASETANHMGSRQAVYLNSTVAEVYRFRRDLDESLRQHRICFELSEQQKLPGWQGHGALGMAETYRMMGESRKANEMFRQAQACYEAADGQSWGLIHVGIARYYSSGGRTYAEDALRLAQQKGYGRDIAFLEQLLSVTHTANRTWTKTGHNDHFLLFP